MIESRVLCASDIGTVCALRGVPRMVGWFLCSPAISFLFFFSLRRIVLDFRANFYNGTLNSNIMEKLYTVSRTRDRI